MIDLFLPRLAQYFLLISGVLIWGIFYALYKNYCLMERIALYQPRRGDAWDPTEERRFSNRIPSRAALGLKVESGNGEVGTATLHDVSKTGACFESTLLLKPKQKVLTRMHSARYGSIHEFSARVVWIRPRDASYLYGVQFLSRPTSLELLAVA